MEFGDLLLNALFYIFAILGLAGAVSVALSTNIVRSAFALLMVLFAVAALYAIMKADLMVAAQVLIYVGGILVLIMFAIMLTHRITDVNLSNDSTHGPVAVAVVVSLLMLLGVLILSTPEREPVKLTDETLAAKYAAVGTQLGRDAAKYAAVGTQLGGDSKKARPLIEKLTQGEPEEREEAARSLIKLGLGARVALEESRALADEPTQARIDAILNEIGPNALTRVLGYGLMSAYLLPFEVISVLLLAALIGAAFLARKEVRT